RGVGIGGGVDNDGGGRTSRFLDPGDQLAFVVRLAEVDGQSVRLGFGGAELFDIGKRIGAIGRRFADAQQVEVRSVEDQDALGHGLRLVPPTLCERNGAYRKCTKKQVKRGAAARRRGPRRWQQLLV